MDLVHSDVCGPMQVDTVGGLKYSVTFIDDYSCYCTIYLLKQKSEVKVKLAEFIEFVKTQFNRNSKIIRSDQGGEYIGHETQDILK
jgi:transposase InsO family protein